LNLQLAPVEVGESRYEWLPLVAFGLAALFGVVIFLPPEGVIGVPLHDALVALLGRAAFLLPLGLVVAGVLLLTKVVRPDFGVPYRRLVGIGLMTIAVLPIEHFFGGGQEGAGRVGEWLSASLVDLVGGPATAVVVVLVLAAGVMLAFDLRPRRLMKVRHAAES
jgi:hypothetical protein